MMIRDKGQDWSRAPTPVSVEEAFSYRFQREHDFRILDFQPSNCETTNFYCFKPLSLWDFVTTAPGNEHSR